MWLVLRTVSVPYIYIEPSLVAADGRPCVLLFVPGSSFWRCCGSCSLPIVALVVAIDQMRPASLALGSFEAPENQFADVTLVR